MFPLKSFGWCSCNFDFGVCLFQDGWVGFKAVLFKQRLTAADFYNGYLHQTGEGLFVSRKSNQAHRLRDSTVLWCSHNFLHWREQCKRKNLSVLRQITGSNYTDNIKLCTIIEALQLTVFSVIKFASNLTSCLSFLWKTWGFTQIIIFFFNAVMSGKWCF